MDDKKNVLEKIDAAFFFLRDSGEDIREEIVRHAQIVHIPKGEFIFFEGDECR